MVPLISKSNPSPMAKHSLTLGALGVGCGLFALVLDFPGLVFGALFLGIVTVVLAVFGCIEVFKSGGEKRGIGLACLGLALAFVGLFLGTSTVAG